MNPKAATNNNPIKYKFFRSLGIRNTPSLERPHQNEILSSRRLLVSSNHQEKLKYNQRDDDSHRRRRRILTQGARKQSPKSIAKKGSPKKRISFDNNVTVMPIPQRSEYSNRIASRIWSRRDELIENMERNSIEFASEGWDWRSAMEDENMLVNIQTGELIHPVHFER